MKQQINAIKTVAQGEVDIDVCNGYFCSFVGKNAKFLPKTQNSDGAIG